MLVCRSVCERELLDFVFRRTTTRLEDNEGHRLLSLHLIINRYHCSLGNVRVSLQHTFYVTWIDVFAAGIEHVIHTADKIMKTVFVAAKYIPGYVESVGRNRRFDSRAIVISNHNRWTFDLQRTLAGVSFIASHEPELNFRMWAAD